MAAKRKSSPAPAAAQSSSSDDDTSSDAEQYVTQRKPSLAETPKRTERDDDESDSGSGSESDPEPPIKTLKTAQKPSESEDSSEEDEEEQEEVEKMKSPTKEPESQSEKKKQKISAADQSPSKKSSIIQRIWSLEDEVAILRALSQYHVKNGKLPPRKDYGSFLSGISGSIGFPVAENQLFNKIRQLRFNHAQKKKKGSKINFSQPHEKAVFDLCSKLFEDGSNTSKKGVSSETNRDAETKGGGKRKKEMKEPKTEPEASGGMTMTDGGVANGGAVNGIVTDGGDVVRSHFYLEGLIKEMISTEKCPRWLSTVDDVVVRIGESRAQDLEEKTKILRIDEIKLCTRKKKLMAELFDILACETMDD